MPCYQRTLPTPPNMFPAAECAFNFIPPPGKVLSNPNATFDDVIEFLEQITTQTAAGAPFWGVISGNTIYIGATDYGAQGMPIDLINVMNDGFFDSP